MQTEGHKTVVSNISDEELIKLTTLRDWPGVLRLTIHIFTIFCLCAIVSLSDGWVRFLVQIPLGIMIVFLFAAEHESIHFTAFRTRWLNYGAAYISGVFLLLPPLWFRYFHFAHHRHTQDPDKDPELQAKKPQDILQYLIALTGAQYWYGMIKVIITNAAGHAKADYIPAKRLRILQAEAIAFIGFYATIIITSIMMGSFAFITYWIIPILLGQPFLRAYLMAEHTACPMVPDMLINTRTTFTAPVVKWLAWNMPNHTAHHAVPTVPFYNLNDLTEHLKNDLMSTANGYTDAHKQIRADL